MLDDNPFSDLGNVLLGMVMIFLVICIFIPLSLNGDACINVTLAEATVTNTWLEGRTQRYYFVSVTDTADNVYVIELYDRYAWAEFVPGETVTNLALRKFGQSWRVTP